jgi:L-glutamine-phosphate cytidylyltransferase
MTNINAIILAAGQGTRMKHLTKDTPKCMVTIGQKKIIDYQLDALIENKINDVIIVVGHKKEKLISYIKNSIYNKLLDIKFIENPIYSDTNSCYSLWVAREYMKNGYIHLNSDLIFHPQLLKNLLNNDSSAIIVDNIRQNEDDMVRGLVNNNTITEINKTDYIKNSNCLIVGPIYFSKNEVGFYIDELEKEIRSGELSNACYLLFNKTLNKFKYTPIYADGLFWKEVDTLEDIKYVEQVYEIFSKTHDAF